MFVPDDFEPPAALDTPDFSLRPLGVEHNERDYAAWVSSIDHIRSTPGFPDGRWPREMTLEENGRDLARHAEDFRTKRGFTYTVLRDDDVIGCVYIYPLKDRAGADVRSWVRASDAALDVVLYDAVTWWLDTLWPFEHIEYAERRRP